MAMFNGTNGVAAMGERANALMGHAERVLDLILEALDTRIEQIAVTDQATEPGLQKDFPTPGSQRWILNRSPDGREFEAPIANALVLPANPNRLGGTIVNMGQFPVKVFMAEPKQINAGTGFVYLTKEGGSWDFRLGHLLWSGSVSVVAIGGVSQLAVVEV